LGRFGAKNMKKIIITTSWDDGNILDLKLADFLNKYGLKGTFYIPKNCEFRSLSDDQVKLLAETQEVGAHTMTHPALIRLYIEKAKEEILESKKYLENLLGLKIKMFCYPGGWHNNLVKEAVKAAGFLGARTVDRLQVKAPQDFFEFGTTLQVYPLTFMQKLRFWSWSNYAKRIFKNTLKNGEVFHLWGHSWEIDKYRLWPELEKFFKFIGNKENAVYLTNGEFLSNL
jgi:peptidoglycan/xylan/chitin deacetylase (PgdA/CDA1 family)